MAVRLALLTNAVRGRTQHLQIQLASSAFNTFYKYKWLWYYKPIVNRNLIIKISNLSLASKEVSYLVTNRERHKHLESIIELHKHLFSISFDLEARRDSQGLILRFICIVIR